MIADSEDIYRFLAEEGLSEDEIENQVEDMAKHYEGFMTPEAILFLVAKNHGFNKRSPDIDPEIYKEIEDGIDYDEFLIKISEIKEGMSNIVIVGRIKSIFKTNNFTRKDGTSGKVGSFLLDDGSDTIKVNLWDDQLKITTDDYFKFNEIIRIIGGYAKIGYKDKLEVSIGRKGKIQLAPKEINPKIIPPSLGTQTEKKKENFIQSITGTVSKIIEFKEIDLKNGEKSFLLKFELMVNSKPNTIVAWEMNAINTLKSIEIGKEITMENCHSKLSDYTHQEEITISNTTKIF